MLLRPRVLLPALLSLIALGSGPAVAVAQDDPTVPLLTGGELAYTGTADTAFAWDWHTPDYSPGISGARGEVRRQGHIAFEARWLVEGRYPGVPSVRPIQDITPPTDYKVLIGTGNGSTHQVTHPEPGRSETFDAQCAWDVSVPEPPPIYPYDDTGRTFQVDAVFVREETESGSCTNTHGTIDTFAGYSNPLERLFTLPAAPPRVDRQEQQVSLDRDRARDRAAEGQSSCLVGPVENERCDDTISGTGTLTYRCALCVDELRYEHPDVPGGGWTTVPASGTFDGNRIRVTAKVRNATKQAITAPIALRDMTHGRALTVEGLPQQVTVPAGATVDVVGEWDSMGFAWEKGPGEPTFEHDLAFLTPFGSAQKVLRVRPKPVVLVHGWNADASTWSAYPGFVQGESVHWVARVVSTMNTDPTGTRSVFDNAQALGREIREVRERLDADHVDLVAHSMGGLISRAYVHGTMGTSRDGRPWVSHLVMIGTPNMGSPCANLVYLATSGRPTLELMPGYVDGPFNRSVTNRKGVPFSILAGDKLYATCGVPGPGDVVVEVPSAYWQIGDRSRLSILHTSMTGSREVFDGYVTPRLEVGPGGGASARAARTAGAGAGTGRTAPVATASRAGTAVAAARAPQVQQARTVTVRARRPATLAVPAERGALGIVLVAPADMTSELLDARGRVVAAVRAGSELAAQPVRTLGTTVRRPGRYRLRLSGPTAAKVPVTVTLRGSRTTLTATARQVRPGAKVVVRAVLRGAARTARVTALVRGTGRRPMRLVLRRGRRGAWSATTRRGVAGTAGVTVTARSAGRVRIAAAAAR